MSGYQVVQLVVWLFAIVTGIYALGKFIDSRVRRCIADDAFLRKLASTLRPTALFDQHGAVFLDQGAMNFIDSIRVTTLPNSPLPASISVVPNRFLSHPPLITTLENELVHVSETRGPMFQIDYSLDYEMWRDSLDNRRFRIEIFL